MKPSRTKRALGRLPASFIVAVEEQRRWPAPVMLGVGRTSHDAFVNS